MKTECCDDTDLRSILFIRVLDCITHIVLNALDLNHVIVDIPKRRLRKRCCAEPPAAELYFLLAVSAVTAVAAVSAVSAVATAATTTTTAAAAAVAAAAAAAAAVLATAVAAVTAVTAVAIAATAVANAVATTAVATTAVATTAAATTAVATTAVAGRQFVIVIIIVAGWKRCEWSEPPILCNLPTLSFQVATKRHCVNEFEEAGIGEEALDASSD